MGYDTNKDIKLTTFIVDDSSKSPIVAGIYSYDGENPKLQIGREYSDKSGNTVYCRLGRLNVSEVKELYSKLGEIIEYMESKDNKK